MFRTVPLAIIRSFHCIYSNGISHAGLLTAYEQDQDRNQFLVSRIRTENTSLRAGSGRNQFRPDPARKLSANLYDIYHCCVYSEKLLMMDRGTVRKMESFIPKINLRN